MFNGDIISMPDKWEYPWYAAWDLAFHTIALSLVDFDFAKEQLLLMLAQPLRHPNGQIPAYEWNFSDVNPPGSRLGDALPLQDRAEPRPGGHQVPGALLPGPDAQLQLVGEPEGPRRDGTSSPAASWASTTSASSTAARRSPRAGSLEQADGTAWMAFYCQNMLEIALILADHDPVYEEHRLQVPPALRLDLLRHGPARRAPRRDVGRGGRLLLRRPSAARRDGMRLKVRSMVGLLPLCASTVFEGGRLASASRS